MSRDARLRLAFCGFHPDRTRSLLAAWGSAAAVLRAVERGRVESNDRVRAAAAVSADERRSELTRMGVAVVHREDPDYPEDTALLPDAPDVLFLRGRLPPSPGVAVVGTRRCSSYGRDLARAIGRAIAAAGWPLISGLARGVDASAHHGTVDGHGIGVAVLGSGPDVWYPPEHRPLGESLISSGGGVVTEYPPGTPPEGWRFPPRNRIISAASAAVVVVEAGERGGALITAGYALEHGRSVFAVPGDVDRESSRGCNLLIRDGAHPVLDPDELIEELSLVLGPPPSASKKSVDARAEDAGEEDALVRALGPVGRSIDELAEQLGLSGPEILSRVGRLEAEGRVRRCEGQVMLV